VICSLYLPCWNRTQVCALLKNLTESIVTLPLIGGSREVQRHWWVRNTGFLLVVGKINFRVKKIGGSRKVNWWGLGQEFLSGMGHGWCVC
jgi:hypothetical protein